MDGEPSVSTPLLPSKQGDPWRQYLASLLACLLSMATGCVAGWSAPAIPYLQNNVVGALRVDTPITDSEASWIASIITIGDATDSGPVHNWYCVRRMLRGYSPLQCGDSGGFYTGPSGRLL
uniref:Uncharacterized protein n=1 Tax=Cacopsylla melanoneura TaxID=428564 RepID=A0A8D8WVH5_9HEMI